MGGASWNNAWWLDRVRGVYTYGLSPFYQRAVFGNIGREMYLLKQFVKNKTLTVGPLLLGTVALMHWANEEYHHLLRKDPKEYPGWTEEDLKDYYEH